MLLLQHIIQRSKYMTLGLLIRLMPHLIYHFFFSARLVCKEHISNFTKGITMAINFKITCPLDHPMGHIVSISWDIMVHLLRISVATRLYQQGSNP